MKSNNKLTLLRTALVPTLIVFPLWTACGSGSESTAGGDGDGDVVGDGDVLGDGDGDTPGDGDVSGDGDTPGDGDTIGDGDVPGDGDSPGDGDNTGDGDTPGDGDGDGDNFAPCPQQVDAPTVCVGSVSGAPGETVQAPVHVVLPAGCGEIAGLGGDVSLDLSALTLVNNRNDDQARAGSGAVNNCTRMDQYDEGNLIDFWTWGTWTEGNWCDETAPSGVFLSLELLIDAAAAPGDYSLSFSEAEGTVTEENFAAGCGDWDTPVVAIDGVVRVK